MCFVLFSRARSLRAIYARFPCVLFVMELGVQNRRLLAFRQARESLILGKTSDVAGAAVNLKEAVVDTVLELVASKVVSSRDGLFKQVSKLQESRSLLSKDTLFFNVQPKATPPAAILALPSAPYDGDDEDCWVFETPPVEEMPPALVPAAGRPRAKKARRGPLLFEEDCD